MSKRELSNRKVLVVEDEMMIAMLIEDMLDEFGCRLVGPATNVPRALELIGKEDVQVAVLDLNSGRSGHLHHRRRATAKECAFHFCDRIWGVRPARGIRRSTGAAEAFSSERSRDCARASLGRFECGRR